VGGGGAGARQLPERGGVHKNREAIGAAIAAGETGAEHRVHDPRVREYRSPRLLVINPYR